MKQDDFKQLQALVDSHKDSGKTYVLGIFSHDNRLDMKWSGNTMEAIYINASIQKLLTENIVITKETKAIPNDVA